jgi:PilZ domain-containing protein
VYPVTISQSNSRPNERRRNTRHRAPSIIYVQLGSGNGGIVVNLGMDGVAFHAAQKLTAEVNSTVNLRLRGSGLNADLDGELVWIGATQKEAGICFKNLSAEAKQDIANWIEREAQVFEPVEIENRPRPNLLPTTPVISTARENSAPHPLSTALAMSRSMPAETLSSSNVAAPEPYLPPIQKPLSGALGAAPLLEIVPPVQTRNVAADELTDRLPDRKADSSAVIEPRRVEKAQQDDPLFEPVPIDRPYQFPTSFASPAVLPKEPKASVKEELPTERPVPTVKNEPEKTAAATRLPGNRVSARPNKLNDAGLEKWIPPALLAAWNGSNVERKLMLAVGGTACLAVSALLLVFGVTRMRGSIRPSTASEFVQTPAAQPVSAATDQQALVAQATETPAIQQSPAQQTPVQKSTAQQIAAEQTSAPPAAASSSSPGPTEDAAVPTPPPPSTPVPAQSHQPPDSVLSNLASNLFGIQSQTITPITDAQIGVQVWTSQRSGWYYCTDSDYYKRVQPGAFMAQEDALQSGYRPRLGQFCN